jgi:hypothetical protein
MLQGRPLVNKVNSPVLMPKVAPLNVRVLVTYNDNNDKKGRAGARSRLNEFSRKNQPAGLPTLVHTSSRHIGCVSMGHMG